MQYDLLVHLYVAITRPILSEWIDDRSLSRVDSAYCNSVNRPHVMNLFTFLSISNIENPMKENYDKKNDWILRRGLRVRKMVAVVYLFEVEKDILRHTKILEYLVYSERFLPTVESLCTVKSKSLYQVWEPPEVPEENPSIAVHTADNYSSHSISHERVDNASYENDDDDRGTL